MKAKRCLGACGQTKELSAFYKHSQMADGHLNYCKECVKRRVAQDRIDNPEKLAQRDRDRYYNDPDRKEQCHKASKKGDHNHPLHKKARTIASNAVRDGKLQKQPCEACGAIKVEAHHEDYTKPLEVRWLCRRHHMEQHRLYDLNQQSVNQPEKAA